MKQTSLRLHVHCGTSESTTIMRMKLCWAQLCIVFESVKRQLHFKCEKDKASAEQLQHGKGTGKREEQQGAQSKEQSHTGSENKK